MWLLSGWRSLMIVLEVDVAGVQDGERLADQVEVQLVPGGHQDVVPDALTDARCGQELESPGLVVVAANPLRTIFRSTCRKRLRYWRMPSPCCRETCSKAAMKSIFSTTFSCEKGFLMISTRSSTPVAVKNSSGSLSSSSSAASPLMTW